MEYLHIDYGKIRNMFWLIGQLDMSPKKQLSEQERIELEKYFSQVRQIMCACNLHTYIHCVHKIHQMCNSVLDKKNYEKLDY